MTPAFVPTFTGLRGAAGQSRGCGPSATPSSGTWPWSWPSRRAWASSSRRAWSRSSPTASATSPGSGA
ncbi:MAG: hypothetical protein MZV64_49515 [Ignavibacteriales bacterium]|nr:hypothetical protein [Ignavibacteriales bacterium]